MDVDGKKPGEELDVLVDELVMGFVQLDRDDWYDGMRATPKYSTDIAAAWEVWKRIFCGKYYDVEFLYRFTEYFEWDTDLPLYEIFQGIDPESICLAALKAVNDGMD